MDAFEILVVILSITLAIFLVLAIVATAYLIKVLKNAEKISDHVETVASNLESASNQFKKFSAPAGVVQFFTQMLRKK